MKTPNELKAFERYPLLLSYHPIEEDMAKERQKGYADALDEMVDPLKALAQLLVNVLNEAEHSMYCELASYTITGSGEADLIRHEQTDVCTCGLDEAVLKAKEMGFTPTRHGEH